MISPAPRIYLDNAATSWPKPEEVYRAVDRYLREVGAPEGRSSYGEAMEVASVVRETRAAVARLLHVDDPRRIIYTYSGTDALNLAIHGTVSPGDHVVTTVCEHNSVLRPLRHLATHHGVQVSHVACGLHGIVDPDDVQRALRPTTKLVVMIHASNVTGCLQPVAEVGRMLHDHGALFLVDAAQSLGHVPISAWGLGADLIAAPGHKGLLGPLGTGILYVAPGVETKLQSVRQGGTGSLSHEDQQPELLPDKYEAGNLNMPGIFGLAAALANLAQRGVDDLRRHIEDLTALLLEGFADSPGVRLLGDARASQRVGVVSIQLLGYDPTECAAMLDASYRIQVRAGLHCAPLMHQALGTLESGGTVRFSPGPFNTREEMLATIAAVREIACSSFTT
jgi:cysteine desulfurase family protein